MSPKVWTKNFGAHFRIYIVFIYNTTCNVSNYITSCESW